ncbi:MAG: PIG-L deacetylase family protein [Candidatus Acetothermia bacterium]
MSKEEAIEGESILVFAPHNDDEILATGGIIQRYLKEGSEVTVAVITNGDGQFRRPTFLPFFRPDFVKLGYRRQRETLEALDYLGLDPDAVKFFGYPDRGLSRMWTDHWEPGDLYYSKYTKTDHSPYQNSYRPETPYCGSAVTEDVKKLMLEVEPDVVYLPHPNDSHPDHWATNGFVLYGLERLKEEGCRVFDDLSMLSYLIHSVKFPSPRGKHLQVGLSQPPNLEQLDTRWVKVSLELMERIRKFRAIGKYRTQTQLMRKYLISFARANELFGIVPSLTLNRSTDYGGATNLSPDFIEDERDDVPFLSYLNPKRKSRLATLRRYPDIRSVKLVKEEGALDLYLEFFNQYRSGNEILVTFKPVDTSAGQDGVGPSCTFRFLSNKLFKQGEEVEESQGYSYESGPKSYHLSIPLERLGSPRKLILSITLARKGFPFARSANRLIKIE